MKQDSVRSAAYTVDCEDYVHVVEFSPFDSGEACSLIAYGGNNYVVVGTCRFPEEDAEVERIQYKMLRTFHHGVRVDAIAWSPETRLNSLPPQIRFCTAAADRKLRLFTSDLQEKNEYKIFDGHSDYINDLVFAPKEGQVIASVGDDHTCRVWDLEGNQKAYFVLRSPGVSVCWHPEEAFKLMVAEKNGTIRFYDLTTQQAILSLESGQMPLMSADWCLKNTFRIGAVAGNDWLIWDIRSRYPQDKRPVHADRAKLFRWSRVNENLFATTGYPGKMSSQLLVHHSGHPQVPAIQQKRTVAFLNQFVVHTVQFLNRFSTVCEELSSIPGLEDVKFEVSSGNVNSVTNGPVLQATTEQQSTSVSPQSEQNSIHETGLQKTEAAEENVITVAKDPRYARYLKMVQVGVPVMAIRNKMISEGLDPDLLETPNAAVPAWGDDVNAEESSDSESSFSD
uniref:Nucleoporin Nup37 n=1 Tax=Crocodylus porosus TaxID=8502 RepID=A0A7M4FL19_CROPO